MSQMQFKKDTVIRDFITRPSVTMIWCLTTFMRTLTSPHSKFLEIAGASNYIYPLAASVFSRNNHPTTETSQLANFCGAKDASLPQRNWQWRRRKVAFFQNWQFPSNSFEAKARNFLPRLQQMQLLLTILLVAKMMHKLHSMKILLKTLNFDATSFLQSDYFTRKHWFYEKAHLFNSVLKSQPDSGLETITKWVAWERVSAMLPPPMQISIFILLIASSNGTSQFLYFLSANEKNNLNAS